MNYSIKTLFKGRHLSLREYREGDIRWEFVSRNIDPKIVYVIAWRDLGGPNEGLVVLRQYRYGIGKYVYEFPAGIVDPNETEDIAARREFLEETGWTLNSELIIDGPYSVSAGLTDEFIFACYGTVDINKPRQELGLEPTEKIRPMLVKRIEFRTLFKDKDTVMDIKLATYLKKLIEEKNG